jgi:hypothetical protein
MDEDLKRVAEAAAEFVAGGENPLTAYLTAFPPAVALSLFFRLSAAADRERELVEALRPFAVWAERMPEGSYEVTSDIANVLGNAIANGHLTGAHFRNAARVVQAKEPT